MKRILLWVLLAAGAAALSIGIYQYNKPVASLSDKPSDYSLTAGSLCAAYEADETGSDAKYLGRVLEVTGKVRSLAKEPDGRLTVHLETGNLSQVSCEMEPGQEEPAKLAVNNQVTLKGLCSGRLLDVVLVNCVNTR